MEYKDEYKEESTDIKLKCIEDFEDYLDVSIYDDSVVLYSESLYSHVSIEATKESLKEFATKILKELDNDKDRIKDRDKE